MTRPIKALGEIALRTGRLEAMWEFYAHIVGLEPMARWEDIAFFRIASGHGGHTTALALFDEKRPGNAARQQWEAADVRQTTLHHLAFTIDLADFEAERARLIGLGQEVRTSEHAWVHWRSLYINDPDGNVVEWVCYDETVG